MRAVLILALAVSSLFSQSMIVDISTQFNDISFNADKIKVSSTGYYLLDSDDRQIMFINNNMESLIAGGYGTTEDSFIDPIEILASKLKVYIIDSTENNIIIYDHKLNYLTSIKIEEIYPSFSGIDDWENIYLYSQIENKVYKLTEGESILKDFIDLAIYNINEKTVIDFYIGGNGEIAILADETLSIFNRLGNVYLELPLDKKINFVFKQSNDWFGFDVDNDIINLKYSDLIHTLMNEDILDIDYFNDRLYILLKNQIWVFDVELE